MLIAVHAERKFARAAQVDVRQEREAREVERKMELRERVKVSHLHMFKTVEYVEWDADGIPTVDMAGEVSEIRRNKLLEKWEKQKKQERWPLKQWPA